MTSKNAAPANKDSGESNLDGRYGEIGIPAVAAALRYKSDAKNPAYAPAVPRDDDWMRAELVAA
ncbi:MAG: hypothetical protein ACRECO_22195 [Xanthobacteraceae bacterium]